MARALEAASGQQRDLLVAALNIGSLIVHLETPSPDTKPLAENEAAPYLTRLYNNYAAELEGRDFRVEGRGDQAMQERGYAAAGRPGAVRLLVRLHTGDLLVVERAPMLLQRLVARFAIIGGAATVILLLVLLYCIRAVVLPARHLAQATRDLAVDINTPDLPATGATEIGQLAVAFNNMKHTIRGLMNERTRMLAAIAHDCRTYLTRLRLRVDFIDDPQQHARAIRDLDDMSLLLDDTLVFARETTAAGDRPPERCDVVAELASLTRIRQEIGEPVTLETPTAERLDARCAPLALRRMLANLTDNALRYGKTAELGALREGNTIRLSIADRGPGIPGDELERILKPFERLEPSRSRQTGGAGLGLAIVSALAKSQGGELKIENRSEGGLCAILSLPAAD
ncbi:HAMP domain-containing protein [Bradyrhizobium tropiciagri]|uniref:ATP-binding protein n=1 Tax=Bradyrhizobium tropiciagri TaxID=312253 RepID=UPI001BA55476|nr:ATP-binding protein [Bradyrhizobium tropiciagri]MBR0873486.1 HAMP domain-containing protein [Bradyrhizobium tropiciagri]